MYIEAALLCQAFFALPIFLQALMHRQNQILKNLFLWKGMSIVLIVSLVVQKLEGHLERMRARSRAQAQATMLGLIIQMGFARLRGSAGPRHNLATAGKPIYFALDYFLSFIELLFLKLFCFSSPADKVSRTTTSGDDARVRTKDPSIPVDPSKGTKTAPPKATTSAGSSKGGGAALGGEGCWR